MSRLAPSNGKTADAYATTGSEVSCNLSPSSASPRKRFPNIAKLATDPNYLSQLTLPILQQVENCGAPNFPQAVVGDKGNGWVRLFYCLFQEPDGLLSGRVALPQAGRSGLKEKIKSLWEALENEMESEWNQDCRDLATQQKRAHDAACKKAKDDLEAGRKKALELRQKLSAQAQKLGACPLNAFGLSPIGLAGHSTCLDGTVPSSSAVASKYWTRLSLPPPPLSGQNVQQSSSSDSDDEIDSYKAFSYYKHPPSGTGKPQNDKKHTRTDSGGNNQSPTDAKQQEAFDKLKKLKTSHASWREMFLSILDKNKTAKNPDEEQPQRKKLAPQDHLSAANVYLQLGMKDEAKKEMKLYELKCQQIKQQQEKKQPSSENK